MRTIALEATTRPPHRTSSPCTFAAVAVAAGLAASAAGAAPDQPAEAATRAIAGTIDVAKLSPDNGFSIDSHLHFTAVRLGLTASSAGDINGDGFGDVVFGTELGGFATVVYGATRKHFRRPVKTADLFGDGGRGFFIGSVDDVNGSVAQVSGGGDFDGDGFDDLVIGGPGVETTWIIRGARRHPTVHLDPRKAPKKISFRIDGPTFKGTAAPEFGASVSMLGDVDGDGLDDVAIGAPKDKTGTVYVVFGRREGRPTFAVDDLDGRNGFRLVGEKGGRAGTLVAAAGDVNGDGIADILVGAPGTAPGGRANAGTLYVVFGRKGGFPEEIDLGELRGTSGFAINGPLAGDRLGQPPRLGPTAASAGDVNGDGIDDLVLTADGGTKEEAARAGFVVFGSRRPFPKNLDLTGLNGRNGFRVRGSGRSASGVGDVNGDGIGDVMFGGGEDPLYGYVVLGRTKPFPGLVELGETKDVATVRVRGFGGSGPVAGAGDVDRDGLDDIVVGAPWFDDHRQGVAEGGGFVLFGQAWKASR